MYTPVDLLPPQVYARIHEQGDSCSACKRRRMLWHARGEFECAAELYLAKSRGVHANHECTPVVEVTLCWTAFHSTNSAPLSRRRMKVVSRRPAAALSPPRRVSA